MKNGAYWLNRIGIALLLFGVLFLFKYSIDNGWLKPWIRVAFGLAKKDKETKADLTKEILEEGKQWLKEYVEGLKKNTGGIPPDVLQIEGAFYFKINDQLSVRGFIDRIDQVDDKTIRVVDYKTSSNPSYLKPFQLTTYSIAAKNKYPNKEIEASYVLIRHDFNTKDYKITDDDRENAIGVFKKVASEINTLKDTSPAKPWKPTPTPDGSHTFSGPLTPHRCLRK